MSKMLRQRSGTTHALAAVLGALSLHASPAPAQDSAALAIPPASPADTAPTAPLSGPATQNGLPNTAATPDGAGVADIVVTAERRSERVQKSSLAITVLGGDALRQAGVSQARDIVALVPGLQISAGGNTLQTFIRGVGDVSSSAIAQSAVAYNIDGIYIGDTSSVSALFYDIARIEVLKGPQGTLYGRNASGGALNIITNRPQLGRLSGEATLELGNYDMQRVAGAVNLPLGETAALRGSVNYVHRDGYLSDGADDDKQKGGRLQLLLQPTEELSAIISGDIEHRTGRGPDSVLTPRQAGNGKFTGNTDPENNAAILAAATLPPFLVYTAGAGLPPAPGVATGLLRDTYVDNLQRNVSAQVDYDLGGGATVTFIPTYRWADDDYGSYLAGGPFLTQERIRQDSYELRVTRNTASLKAVAGLYYLNLDQFSRANVYLAQLPGLITDQSSDFGTKSYAAFAQGTLSLTDRLRLIGGARYTHERRSIDTVSSAGATVVVDSRTTFNAFTFRAGGEFDLSPANMLYATVSKGFKSGGFNVFVPTAIVSNVFRPEVIYAYTLGSRNRFFDNKVQFNIEGFYWDYRNSQQSHLAFTPAGTLQFLTLNAASARLYGADADLVVKPTRADTVTASLSFLNARFKSFVYEQPLYTPGTSGCAITPTTTGGAVIDCSRKPLPRAPHWSGTAGYQHRFDLGATGSLLVGGDISFASRRYTAVDYIATEHARSYLRENAAVTYTAPGDHFTITGYVRNISNKEVHIGGVEAPFSPGFVYDTVDAPRSFGVRIGARF